MYKDYHAPSKDQGEQLGVVLHEHWGMKNQAELQGIVLSEGFVDRLDSPIVNALWQELSARYPKLNELNLWHDSRYHIVLGCISQFNYDDIEYFIQVDWRQRPKDIEARSDALRERFGYGSFQWVPSAKTLDKIEAALMAKAA